MAGNLGLLSSISIVVLLLLLRQGYSQDFGYSEQNGPSHWGEKYSECVGKHQSPIDIAERNVKAVKLDDVIFDNFKEMPNSATITNNGHTVMVQLDCEVIPEISGGPLQGTYRFAQFHFHWGENDYEGSENTVNNNRFPMELHMVFYKTEYGNSSEAMFHSDGLAVLAFLYRISQRNNTYYDGIISVLDKVENPEITAKIRHPPTLDSLLSHNRKQYFTYNGSLTTPPCSEVVIWIEFKEHISMSHKQLQEFRNLNDEDGKMTHNFRPTQPLYDRLIYYNPGDDISDISNNEIDNDDEHSQFYPAHRGGSQTIEISFTILQLFMIYVFLSYF